MRNFLVVCTVLAAAALAFAKPHGSVATMAAPDEPGPRLVVRGRVFDASGRRPVAGATVYAYHTDASGRYNVPGAREPRLRAHVVTEGEGRFELRTVRPGAYPGRRDPAHIHLQVRGGGHPQQWVDDVRFSDDPRVTPAMLADSKAKGRFAPIVTPSRDARGVHHVTINIRLRNEARP